MAKKGIYIPVNLTLAAEQLTKIKKNLDVVAQSSAKALSSATKEGAEVGAKEIASVLSQFDKALGSNKMNKKMALDFQRAFEQILNMSRLTARQLSKDMSDIDISLWTPQAQGNFKKYNAALEKAEKKLEDLEKLTFNRSGEELLTKSGGLTSAEVGELNLENKTNLEPVLKVMEKQEAKYQSLVQKGEELTAAERKQKESLEATSAIRQKLIPNLIAEKEKRDKTEKGIVS